MPWGSLIFLVAAQVILGVFGALVVGLGCSENLSPGNARSDVCTAIGEPGDRGWWILGCGPAFLFGALALVGQRRGPLDKRAGGIFAAIVVVDAILIAIVTDNL